MAPFETIDTLFLSDLAENIPCSAIPSARIGKCPRGIIFRKLYVTTVESVDVLKVVSKILQLYTRTATCMHALFHLAVTLSLEVNTSL